QRQAIASLLKLVASICVSGAYFVAPRSPAYVLHSPPMAPCWARIGPAAIAIAAADDTTETRRSHRAFIGPPCTSFPTRPRDPGRFESLARGRPEGKDGGRKGG